MKTMQGALSLACSKRSRTREAPTPTNISTNSEPDRVKNGTSASPATARASRVLPVPGRTHQEHALGDAPAQALVLPGILEEVDDLHQFRLGLVHAGHIGEGGLQLLPVVDLVLRSPKRQGLGGTPAHPAHDEHPDGDHDGQGDHPPEEEILPEGRLDAPGELDLLLFEVGDEGLVVDPGDARDRERADLLVGAQHLAQAVSGGLGGAGRAPGLASPRISRSVSATFSILPARSNSRNSDIGSSMVRGARSQDCRRDRITAATRT